MAFDAVKLRGANIHARGVHGRLAVHQVQVAAVVEHQVVVQLAGQNGPEIKGLLVKRHIFLGALVGAHDGGVPAGPAESDKILLQYGHVVHALLFGEVIGGGQAVQPAADDHRVIAGFETGLPTPKGFESPQHRCPLSSVFCRAG
jgi:hypothetical protein